MRRIYKGPGACRTDPISKSSSTKIRIRTHCNSTIHALELYPKASAYFLCPRHTIIGIVSLLHATPLSTSTPTTKRSQCARRLPATPAVCHIPQVLCLSIANISLDKTTWWGCGKHVAGVMESVPKEQWCTCAPQGNQYPPMGTIASA